MSKALKDRIRIVFFDIDDTLYSKNAGLLSPGVEKAFLGLKRRGVIPAIATGRARYIFPAPLEAVIARTGVEHFVTINGQLNLHGQQVVWSTSPPISWGRAWGCAMPSVPTCR